MLNTNTYKLEFQDMLRNQSTSNYMLKDANSKISDGYLIPESDVKDFNKAMEEDCLFRKYATKIAIDWAEGTIVAVCSTGEAKVTGEGLLYPVKNQVRIPTFITRFPHFYQGEIPTFITASQPQSILVVLSSCHLPICGRILSH